MGTRFNNISYCVVLPSLIAGIVAIGTFNLASQINNINPIYPTALLLFFAGVMSYLVGSLVEGRFKWKKLKPSYKTGDLKQ